MRATRTRLGGAAVLIAAAGALLVPAMATGSAAVTHVNEFKVMRTIPFGTHHFANPSDEGLRIYVPRLPAGTYNQVLYPDSSKKLVVSALCDNCAPLGSSL